MDGSPCCDKAGLEQNRSVLAAAHCKEGWQIPLVLFILVNAEAWKLTDKTLFVFTGLHRY